jgi:hypothetical protein
VSVGEREEVESFVVVRVSGAGFGRRACNRTEVNDVSSGRMRARDLSRCWLCWWTWKWIGFEVLSARRRRVSASCAFVGTPWRSVLVFFSPLASA